MPRPTPSTPRRFAFRLGRRIQTVREAMGLSVDELASAAGISRRGLQYIERGKRGLTSVEKAGRIANALSMTLPNLLLLADTGDPGGFRLDARRWILTRRLELLPEPTYHLVLDVVCPLLGIPRPPRQKPTRRLRPIRPGRVLSGQEAAERMWREEYGKFRTPIRAVDLATVRWDSALRRPRETRYLLQIAPEDAGIVIGRTVRRLRMGLARRTGSSRPDIRALEEALAGVERGKNIRSLGALHRAAMVLGVRPSHLVAYEDKFDVINRLNRNKSRVDILRRITNRLERWPARTREDVVGAVRTIIDTGDRDDAWLAVVTDPKKIGPRARHDIPLLEWARRQKEKKQHRRR